MKFSCEKETLLSLIGTASRAVTGKSAMPLLEGLLVTADANTLTLTGYDLSMGIRTTTEADVIEPGSIVLNARLFYDIVRKLPQDVDPPVVTKADADANPIYAVTVQSETMSLIELSQYADINIKERLQTIPGVSMVDTWGLKRYSVRMRMNPDLLAAYGLTPLDVRDAVTAQNSGNSSTLLFRLNMQR